MLNTLCRHVGRSVALLVLGGGIAFSLAVMPPAFADDNAMLIRTVEMDISAMPEAATLDQSVQTADGTFQLIDSCDCILVHMEALRRAYQTFGQDATEKQKLLDALKQRYSTDNENAAKYFDYGYAQLVFEADKNGLFFLRKANDKLATPYTSLAYGLAQVDADRIFEGADPSELTTRKMDVKYKLKDAIRYNLEDRLPGVWTSYVHIIEKLADYPAFDDLRKEDVTQVVVPYGSLDYLYNHSDDASTNPDTPTDASASSDGNHFLAMVQDSDTEKKIQNLSKASEISEDCSYISTTPTVSSLVKTTTVDFDGDKSMDAVNYYKTAEKQPYLARAVTSQNQVVAEFNSYATGNIVEDVDGDGRSELVVRQFDQDPYHPLKVYRWNGKCYTEDKNVTAFFQ